MIADPRLTSLTRQGTALVVLVTSEVHNSIGASARAAPHAHGLVILNDLVGRYEVILDSRRTDNLSKSAFGLASRASALNATIATNGTTHIALVADLVHSAVGARTPATPDANGRAKVPIDHVPRLLLPWVVVLPLEGV